MADDLKMRLDVETSGVTKSGDLLFSDNDLETDEGLETAVNVSLFTDRRANDDDPVDDPEDLRGWWGDLTTGLDDDEIGSKLWLLNRSSTTKETLNRAKTYIEESLQWMVDDEVIAKMAVSTYRLGEVLACEIRLIKIDGSKLSIKFDDLWKAQYGME